MVVVMKDIILKLLSILNTKITVGINTPTEYLIFTILWRNIRIERVQWI